MFTIRTIMRTTLVAIAFLPAGACVGAAQARPIHSGVASVLGGSAESVRQFVQGFYDEYTPIATSDHVGPAWYYVMSRANRFLDGRLAAALRADSIARQASPETQTREILNFDPFLESQDPCSPYEVIEVRRKGSRFMVPVRPCHAKGAGPVVEVRSVSGHWRISDVYYEKRGLKSYLCQYAKGDSRRDKWPTKCP